MKKLLMIISTLLLTGVNAFAGGDLVVNGLLGVGRTPAGNAKLDLSSSNENFGLRLLQTRDTLGPINGSSYFIFLDGSGAAYDNEAGGFSNTIVYRRQSDSNSNSILYAGHNQALIGTSGGGGYTVDNISGIFIKNGLHSNFNSTVTLKNSYGILSGGLYKDGTGGSLTVNNFRHIYLKDKGTQIGTSALSVNEQTGLWVDRQTFGSTNYGIVLNGDGAGADVVFGPNQEARIYSSGGELFVEDGASNVTQISPHDPETGEWVFYSRNTKTGRTVKINMEKLVKAVEKLTGQKFMMETFIEDK